MSSTFQAIFTLGVAHSYYGGACKDLDFLVPADTAALLRNGRMLTRTRDGVLYVLGDVESGGAPRIRLDGRVLRFGVQLKNTFFTNFTTLPFDPGLVTPVWDNRVAPSLLGAPTLSRLASGRVRYDIADPARPVTVEIADRAGQVVFHELVTAESGIRSLSWDATACAPGPYTATATGPASTATERLYLDPEAMAAGCFGVVEVVLGAGLYSARPAFTLSFDAREETLRYYVVAQNLSPAELGQLAVSDTGADEDDRDEIDFERVASGSFGDDELDPDLLTRSGGEVVLFRSLAPVPRRADGRRGLQLRRHHDVLISNLPQPGPERPTAELIVHVSKPQR